MSEQPKTLFESLGGAKGVAEVLGEAYQRIMADEELAPFFRDVSTDHIKHMQTELVAAMTDGPVRYSGTELTEIHTGHGIERKHFSLFCNYLAESLQQHGVAQEVLDQVLARLALYSDRITGSANVDG
jgi:hemoglobin